MAQAFNITNIDDKSRTAIEQALRPLADLPIWSSRKKNPELFLQAQSVAAKRLYYALPKEVRDNLDSFRNGESDHFILRGMPSDTATEPTPPTVYAKSKPSIGLVQLVAMSMLVGRPINKDGIGNTIRFEKPGEDKANEETWHGHPQSGATMFFCMRGDQNAKTSLLTARNTYETASNEVKQELLKPREYVPGIAPFALIKKEGNRYEFSHNLFDVSAPITRIIPKLQLPDMKIMLEGLINTGSDKFPVSAINHILNTMKKAPDISYVPGDLVVYDECATVRYSPVYSRSTSREDARWLKSLGNDPHSTFTDTPNAALIEMTLPALIDRCKSPQVGVA